MTRIAVFSDTHGILAHLPAALQLAGPLDGFVHLGDFGSDAAQIAAKCGLPYHAVRGNCDYGSALPAMQTVQYEDASILLTHGDRFTGVYALALRAEEQHCQAVLFGHTHTPLMTAQGPVLIINPGSLSRPRNASAHSFAVLTIDGRDVNAKIISLD